jgi:hypothetical protein
MVKARRALGLGQPRIALIPVAIARSVHGLASSRAARLFAVHVGSIRPGRRQALHPVNPGVPGHVGSIWSGRCQALRPVNSGVAVDIGSIRVVSIRWAGVTMFPTRPVRHGDP